MRAAALIAALVAGPAFGEGVVSAQYADPTERYAHGVLGDAIEHGTLVLKTTKGRTVRLVLPEARVFEDTEPRVVDVDGDGDAEAVVVESHRNRGARLSVYAPDGLKSSNVYIGSRNRWLAPVGQGVADLDGDGVMELAFVDRPHLAKTLRIYRYRDDTLELVGSLPGVTNHRIGERDIAGGIRDCGSGPEMVVASADWRRVLAVRFDGAGFDTRDLGAHGGRASFAKAMACK